jgi:hypothetical protein
MTNEEDDLARMTWDQLRQARNGHHPTGNTGRVSIFIGHALVECPNCGEEHTSPRYSYGRYTDKASGRAFCDECARTQVPEDEYDILEALNAVDIAVWSAQNNGLDGPRMSQILLAVSKIAEDIVTNYTVPHGETA